MIIHFTVVTLTNSTSIFFPDGTSSRHRRYWISEQGIEVNTCDMGEDMGHTVTEVKIALTMSHNILTSTEEDIQ